MENRVVRCDDGSRWRVSAAGRSSYHRLELVFESLDEPGALLRGEVSSPSLKALDEAELCFLLEELRDAS